MSLYKYSILSFNRRKNSWGKYFPEITMTEFVDSLPLCFQRNKLLSDGSDCEESDCSAGDSGLIPGLERSLGVGNGNLLQDSCWKTPWTEEPGGLQSMEFQRVRHDWVANIFTFIVIMFSEGWVVWEVITCVFLYLTSWSNYKMTNQGILFFFGWTSGVQMLLQPSRCFKESGFLFFPLQFSAVTFTLAFSSYLLIPVRNYIHIPAVKLVRVVLVVKGERNCI